MSVTQECLRKSWHDPCKLTLKHVYESNLKRLLR